MQRVVGVLFLFSLPVVAQFRAGVQGVISDSTGAVVPNATVTLTNTETQRTQKTETTQEGFYGFFGLAPGTYTIEAGKTGFQKQVLSDIRINAEEIQGRNLTLATGDVSQSITVSDTSRPALQTENGDVGKAITTEEVERLPQVGRNPYELLRLTPGVFGDSARGGGGSAANLPNTTGPGGSNFAIFQTENQVPVAANGQRLSENSYRIDGVSVNSLGWGGAAVVTPNQESVKELRVTSGSYSAEIGRNAGAQIDVVSKNGTNQFHGSGVFKLDDPAFNAFNSYGGYNLPPARVDQLFRQYAASVGGPVVKNRLFFFFSYEGLNNRSTNFVNSWIETPQFRQAVIAQRPDSMAAQILNSPNEIPRVVSVANLPCPSGFAPGTCRQVTGGLDIGSIGGARGAYTTDTGGGLDGVPDVQFAQLASPSSTQGNQYNGRVDYTHNND
ncbi:MAG TPA: carboxypeptidase regulatory-like domain-containing protein, partial [Bryobacteraceae bacterium]|nr:carboxypeptidase regulatory-like domain-containing protein [Bryobacteraceae bacterium]